MISKKWTELGKKAKQSSFTDDELKEQLIAIAQVISYFVGRNDSTPIVCGLIQEQMGLENMYRFRQNYDSPLPEVE